MKRTLITILTFLLLSGTALAAGSSNTYSIAWDIYNNDRVAVITWNWVADDADGSVPDSSLSTIHATLLKFYFADMAETTPGGVTAPTALYDVTLVDTGDEDVYGGKMIDRSATDVETVLPAIDGCLGGRPIYTGLTMKVGGNSVNSATGKVVVIFYK